MTETTAYLSPNGQDFTQGAGPTTRLMVATVAGVATLRRAAPDAPWRHTGTSLADRHIGSLLYEPVTGKLFAGAHHDGGLWVSDDGEGARWRQVAKGLARPHIYSLAERRNGDRVTLFLGTQPAGLYRSEDYGESWTELANIRDVPDTDKWIFPAPPHIAHVKNIVFHPRRPETIYVLVEQGALLKSTDDGKSWIELSAYSEPDEAAYRDVHRLLIDSDDPDVFYLATGEGLYRTGDGGKTFDHLTRRGDRMGYPDFLFFQPRDHRTVFMAGARGNPGEWFRSGTADACILRSTDSGRSWTELTEGLPQPIVGAIEAMAQHRWDGGTMLAMGTATGEVYASENDGASWRRIAERLPPVSKDHHHHPFLPPEERARLRGRRPGQAA